MTGAALVYTETLKTNGGEGMLVIGEVAMIGYGLFLATCSCQRVPLSFGLNDSSWLLSVYPLEPKDSFERETP
jgi:hypothetical protein